MIRYFTNHPTAANILMLLIVGLGVFGGLSMNRAVFPEFDSEFVYVQVIYKGATAEEVEETICNLIEEEIEGIEGIDEVESIAREGMGLVKVEAEDGYPLNDLLADVQNAIDQIDSFPANTEEPLVWEFEKPDPVISLTIYADIPENELKAIADQAKNDLLDLDGVSLVELKGISEHQIHIDVHEEALLALGLSVQDVASAIDAQSIDLPAGSIETNERETIIRVVDQKRWAEEFLEIPIIADASGAKIPLRAIAQVKDTFENEWDVATFDGCRAITLDVHKTDAEDVIRVARTVRDFAAQYEKILPPGVRLTAWSDWSSLVLDRLTMLVENGILGFVLVFLSLWLFLDLRISIWVALGIPVSFMGTLWLMQSGGLNLDMITMFSLILALGLIVDDAIVIAENIYSHRDEGKNPRAAATEGAKEVGIGVVSSTLTTVAVFLPLLLMQGEIGKVLRVMPYGVIAALCVSLVEGFFVLPNHLAHSMIHARVRVHILREKINATLAGFINRVYVPLLRWSIEHAPIVLSGVVMLFLIHAGILAGGRIPFQPFPDLDGDFLVARVLLPQGTDFQRTQEIVGQIEKSLEMVNKELKPLQPEQQDLVRFYSTSYGLNSDADETGSHVAEVKVELLSADVRHARCDDIMRRWEEITGQIPDAISLTYDQLQITPGGRAIDIQLQGLNLDELKTASLALREKIATYAGVWNLTDDLRPGKLEIRVQLKPGARNLGISSRALAQQLRAAFWGSQAQEFQRGSDNFEVEVQLQPQDRDSLADIDDFKIVTAGGRQVPFHEAATIEIVRGYSKIVRVDGKRTVRITADVDSKKGNAAMIINDLESNYLSEFLKTHPGVKLNLEGQRKETMETGMSVVRSLVIGILLIFLILSFVFESYATPIIVMTAIPLGLIGAVFGHFVMGVTWCMPSIVGLVALSGIVVNDSIVLVQFVRMRIERGDDVSTAIQEAGRRRFRPVFLTTATTVAGLLPMLLETSLQAQVLIPVAISIAFGLMFATVLTLFFVPCFYVVMHNFGLIKSSASENHG